MHPTEGLCANLNDQNPAIGYLNIRTLCAPQPSAGDAHVIPINQRVVQKYLEYTKEKRSKKPSGAR